MECNRIEFTAIGLRIRSFRKKRCFTQARLAEKVDMDTNSISRIERGVATPNLESLLKICSVLKITPNDVLLESYDAPVPILNAEIASMLEGLSSEELRKVLDYIRFIKTHDRKGTEFLTEFSPSVSIRI